jgi:hypothetical protein
MVPKLHAKGTSFRGAAAYLLHDKNRAKTSNRVAWTETRNLATGDPHVAWKLMAATAMDRDRLKCGAGVKNSGRKSGDVVLHLTLSWHPGEKDKLPREEMMRAGLGALRALRADDRQVLFVCHDDEPQPHLHILINRVSPEDGRMLPSSKEKLVLSQWAEGYERERGQILCEERVINNAARKRGEHVRGEPDTPRHIHELHAAHAHKPGIEAVRKQERHLDADLAKARRQRMNSRRRAWSNLNLMQKQAFKELRQRFRLETQRARQDVRQQFKPRWTELHRVQSEQFRAFEASEESTLGRIRNTLSAIDFKAIMKAGDRRRAVGEAFDAIASKGARLEALKRVHAKAERQLLARQRAEELKAAQTVRQERNAELARRRDAFTNERLSMILVQDMEDAAHRHEWRNRSQARKAAYERHQGTAADTRSLEVDDMLDRIKKAQQKRMDGENRPKQGW